MLFTVQIVKPTEAMWLWFMAVYIKLVWFDLIYLTGFCWYGLEEIPLLANTPTHMNMSKRLWHFIASLKCPHFLSTNERINSITCSQFGPLYSTGDTRWSMTPPVEGRKLFNVYMSRNTRGENITILLWHQQFFCQRRSHEHQGNSFSSLGSDFCNYLTQSRPAHYWLFFDVDLDWSD